jgi:hypothetical protein
MTTYPELSAAAAEIRRRSRTAQQLPEYVEDEGVLAKVAALVEGEGEAEDRADAVA